MILQNIDYLIEAITKEIRQRYADMNANRGEHVVYGQDPVVNSFQMMISPKMVRKVIGAQLATPHQREDKVYMPDTAKELAELDIVPGSRLHTTVTKGLEKLKRNMTGDDIVRHELGHLAAGHTTKVAKDLQSNQNNITAPNVPITSRVKSALKVGRLVSQSDYSTLRREAEADKLAFADSKEKRKIHLRDGNYANLYYASHPIKLARYGIGRAIYKSGIKKLFKGKSK